MLNVSAAAKGLVAGDFTISRSDGTSRSVASEKNGMLVPNSADVVGIDLKQTKWIVVIEKEASFRSIISSVQWEHLFSQIVLITAKGYPDLSTRAFLHRIASANLSATQLPRIGILVDFDPDGISIMSTYAFGSKALAHETAALSLDPDMLYYLGLKSHHLLHPAADGYAATNAGADADAGVAEDRTLQMSGRDRRKARSMLANSALARNTEVDAMDRIRSEGRRELQVMLMLNIKAEMQVLEEMVDGIAGWLARSL
ncbi:DNA topoisomerase IV, alpha subunit [Pseudovirgaria hyperparasitica]|uniref:DNA topoisomerase IV, alpha subunit n=1 Tax=Pseudovirgaria hyperparasitica TaxID=470096 RepID=A0A6A6VXE4_9PEZI|nr:DNA topoisomerase IV, alpha subunit [Pseudovirgaria hyperparasitica]KAF2754845.1 DNA topoisomerase IV, alpha subunit [Pseudovirgaria hyperparasitica]